MPCDSELMRIAMGLVNNVTWVKTILNSGSITGRSTLLPTRLFYNFAIQCLKKNDIQEKKNSLRPILHPVPRPQNSGTGGQAEVSWPLNMVTIPEKAFRWSDLWSDWCKTGHAF